MSILAEETKSSTSPQRTNSFWALRDLAHGQWELMELLMNTLKQRFKEGKGFWNNRDWILQESANLYLWIDHDKPVSPGPADKQVELKSIHLLGFAVLDSGTQTIKFFEVFGRHGQGKGTEMLKLLATVSRVPLENLTINFAASDSYGFWIKKLPRFRKEQERERSVYLSDKGETMTFNEFLLEKARSTK